MANNNDIEKNANKFSQSRPENGKEFEQMQTAQNQLLGIQATQKQNLMEQRLAESNLAAQNDVMRQAAELGAMSGGNMYVNQATQGVMGKYGLQKPITSSSSKTVRTPQGIVINNNTTNITTVPANIGGPIQGRPLQFQAQGSAGESSKFKDWISKAFDKQNEEAKKRNQEYARREVSLTKSSNKIMRKLEEFSRDITKKLDPRNIGRSVGGQIGTIFKLFGMGYLAANTGKILDGIKGFAEKTKNLFEWIKGDKKETPQFIKNFTDSFSNTFQKIIFGDNPPESVKKGGLLGGLKSIFTSLIEDINKTFNDRIKLAKSANKNLKFGNILSVNENIGVLGDRIVNLISILLGGEAAYNAAIGNQVSDAAKENGKNTYGVADEVGNDYYDKSTKHTFITKNKIGRVVDKQDIYVANGDTNLVTGKLKDRSYIPRQYVNDDGSISSSAGGTLAASSNLVANLQNKNTAHIASGFANLYDAAGKNGSAMIHKDLLKYVDQNQLNALLKSGAIKTGLDVMGHYNAKYVNTARNFDQEKYYPQVQKELSDGEFFAFVDPESWWWVFVPREDDEILEDAKALKREKEYQIARDAAGVTAAKYISAKTIQWVARSQVTRQYLATKGVSALGSAAARAAENTVLDSGARIAAMMPKFFQKYVEKFFMRKAEKAAMRQLSKEAVAAMGGAAATPGVRWVVFAIFAVWGIYEIIDLITTYNIPTHTRRLMQMQDFTLTSLDEKVNSGKAMNGVVPNKVRVCPGFYVDGRVKKEEAEQIAFGNQDAFRVIMANAIPENGHNEYSPGADNNYNTLKDNYSYYTGDFGTGSKPSATLINDIHNGSKFWTGEDDMHVDWKVYSKNAESQRQTNYVEFGSSSTTSPNTTTTSEGGGDFDIQSAVDFLAEHAQKDSTGWCARHVRCAMQAGGLSTNGRPGYGGAYADWLLKNGWEEVPVDGNMRAGDVEVLEPQYDSRPGKEGVYHKYGHIQMWGGDTWYSDFKQGTSGNVFGSKTKKRRFRYTGSNGAGIVHQTTIGAKASEKIGDGSDMNDDPLHGKSLWNVITEGASKIWEKAKRRVVTAADGTNTEFIGGILSSHRPIDVNSKPLSGITKEIVSRYSGANYTGGGLEYLSQFGIDNTKTDANSRRVLSSLFDKDGKLKVNISHIDPELAERLKSIEAELKKGNEIDIEQINLTAAGIDATISTSNAQSVATAQAIAGLGGRKESTPSKVSNLGNQ